MKGEMMRALERELVERLVREFWWRGEEVVAAVVADGWPEAMVRAGFSRHEETWDVAALAGALEAELQAVAGERYELLWPERVHHIWPALPGAGMTPVLVGALWGLKQAVRPSSRGLNFGRLVAEIFGWELIEPGEPWEDAGVVVVSGSDATVAEIKKRVQSTTRVVGYGHRVSLVLIVDGPGVDLEELARGVAQDVVLWHQQGCFSPRAVLFAPDPDKNTHENADRERDFCRLLAREIAHYEEVWGAKDVGEAALGQRAQALGLAQMMGPVFSEGLGYVRPVEGPFTGTLEAVHSVTVHRHIAVREGVSLQGLALGGAVDESWRARALKFGATRICEVGRLQVPPAWWWHDGMPNALSFARVVSLG